MKRSLRRYLRKRGASDAEIENAVRGGYVALLALDRGIMPGARRYTMEQIAAEAGTDLQTARAVWRAIGFPDIPDDLAAFTDVRPPHAPVVRRAVRPPVADRLVDGARALAGARHELVARAGRRLDRRRRRRLAAERPCARARPTRRSPRRSPSTRTSRASRSSSTTCTGCSSDQRCGGDWPGNEPDAPGTVEAAVGFVDLVGYTALAEELEDENLAALVQRFIDLAHDTVVGAGGRIVKTIGDEVMFVTDTVATAALDRRPADGAVDRRRAAARDAGRHRGGATRRPRG